MNRRKFIAGLVGGAVLVAAPPPLRTFFLPPAGGWGGNKLLTADEMYRKIIDAMARSLIQTKEIAAAHVLNSGFSMARTVYIPSRLHPEDEPGRFVTTDVTDDFRWPYVTKTQDVVV